MPGVSVGGIEGGRTERGKGRKCDLFATSLNLPCSLMARSLKHLVGLVGELPQNHYSSANHPSSVANAAAISSALQVRPSLRGIIIATICPVPFRSEPLLPLPSSHQVRAPPPFASSLLYYRMAPASPTSAWPASGASWMPMRTCLSTACVGCWRRTGSCPDSSWCSSRSARSGYLGGHDDCSCYD